MRKDKFWMVFDGYLEVFGSGNTTVDCSSKVRVLSRANLPSQGSLASYS